MFHGYMNKERCLKIRELDRPQRRPNYHSMQSAVDRFTVLPFGSVIHLLFQLKRPLLPNRQYGPSSLPKAIPAATKDVQYLPENLPRELTSKVVNKVEMEIINHSEMVTLEG